MKKALLVIAGLFVLVVAAAGAWWVGARDGWLGHERTAGAITGKVIPAGAIAARASAMTAVTPEGESGQILFGDLHVHTTYSSDAFLWALPMLGGEGVYPVGDACDFARYCSGLDFWAITDHAESGTPYRWKETKQAMRQCQAVSGETDSPDLVSFIGFEWTQVGRTPSEHYGHKNVLFQHLGDDQVAARQIAASGVTTATLRTTAQGMSPFLALEDLPERSTYYDFNRFIKDIKKVPSCDPDEAVQRAAGRLLRRGGDAWRARASPRPAGPRSADHPSRLELGFLYAAGHDLGQVTCGQRAPREIHADRDLFRAWQLGGVPGLEGNHPERGRDFGDLPATDEGLPAELLARGRHHHGTLPRNRPGGSGLHEAGRRGTPGLRKHGRRRAPRGRRRDGRGLARRRPVHRLLPAAFQSPPGHVGAVRPRSVALHGGSRASDALPLGFHRIVGQSSGASRHRLQAVRPAQEHGGRRRGRRDDAHAADPPVRRRRVPRTLFRTRSRRRNC